MQIRPQLLALINMSWNCARRSCEFFSGRKVTLVRLIAKACLIRRKPLGLLGRKNEAETERLCWCPRVIWKSVRTAQAYEQFDVRRRDQTGASVSAAPSQGTAWSSPE